MAQAAVVLRRNHEKEKRRREQELLIDQYVNINHNSDTSFSDDPHSGKVKISENPHSIPLQNRQIDPNNVAYNPSPEKDVWVGFYSIFQFLITTVYSTEHANAPHNVLSLKSVFAVYVLFSCTPHNQTNNEKDAKTTLFLNHILQTKSLL